MIPLLFDLYLIVSTSFTFGFMFTVKLYDRENWDIKDVIGVLCVGWLLAPIVLFNIPFPKFMDKDNNL